jgi:hypothetical protein
MFDFLRHNLKIFKHSFLTYVLRKLIKVKEL